MQFFEDEEYTEKECEAMMMEHREELKDDPHDPQYASAASDKVVCCFEHEMLRLLLKYKFSRLRTIKLNEVKLALYPCWSFMCRGCWRRFTNQPWFIRIREFERNRMKMTSSAGYCWKCNETLCRGKLPPFELGAPDME